jgi:hypothetical protein
MKNLVVMPERSSNPVFGDKTFDGLATTGDAMTLDGTVNRSFALVLVLMVGAFASVIAGPGYMLVGAIAGIAGALSSYEFRFVSPNDVALGTSVAGFVMVLVGGAGTLVGPVVGAAVVLSIERVLPAQIPAQLVLGAVFIAFVVFARQGIVGAVRRVVRA